MPTADKLRLAQLLHDGIAQDLVALGYGVDQILAKPSMPIEARKDLRGLRFSIDDLMGQVRSEILALRSEGTTSFEDSLKSVVQSSGYTHEVNFEVEDLPVESSLQSLLLEIAEELLRNAIAHSGASRIDVSLSHFENRIHLRVFDDGKGGAAVKSGRFGLKGIQEKVSDAHGELRIDSSKNGTGAVVVV